MLSNQDKSNLVLIDFGLSLVAGESNSVVVSQVGFTKSYAAPEVVLGYYNEESDYYSLGVVIYELFTGKTPFGDGNVYTSRITKPGNMPEELYDLIQGLTYKDITYRHDLSNPNRRWKYDEVKKWLNGEKYVVPGTAIQAGAYASDRAIPPISFCEKQFSDIDTLCYAMAVEWERGKQLVFRNQLTNHLKNRKGATDNQLLWASIIEDICNNNDYDNDEKLTRILNRLSPDSGFIFCALGAFKTIQEYGIALFERITASNDVVFTIAIASAESLLRSKVLSSYAGKKENMNAFTDTLHIFEERALQPGWERQRTSAIFELAYLLSGKKDYNPGLPDGKVFQTVDELKSYLVSKSGSDYKGLYTICSYLLDGEHQMKPALYGWLRSQGYDVEGFNL